MPKPEGVVTVKGVADYAHSRLISLNPAVNAETTRNAQDATQTHKSLRMVSTVDLVLEV